MKPSDREPSLRLLDYYVIEGINAFACTIFQLGLYFWARQRYGFTNTENLMIGVVQGVSHMVASRIGGRLGDRWGYNRLLVPGLMVASATGLAGWIPDARFMPYLVMALYASAIGLTWPALEAGAMHLPGRLNMPSRLGIYNMVWGVSGSLGFFLCGFLFRLDLNSVLWFAGLLHLLQLAWMAYHRGRHPPLGSTAMAFPHKGDHQPREWKQQLTRMAWLANSLGFYIVGGFAALAPHLGEKLGMSQSQTIWLSSTLLLSRALGFVVFWRWEGWHYRRDWGLAALWSAPVLLAAVFFGPSLPVVAPACALLGISLGLSYYMSLYYSLDASDRKGEQGGIHESIIGIGILCGPLAGAAGGHLTGSTLGAMVVMIAVAALLACAGLTWIARARGGPKPG